MPLRTQLPLQNLHLPGDAPDPWLIIAYQQNFNVSTKTKKTIKTTCLILTMQEFLCRNYNYTLCVCYVR